MDIANVNRKQGIFRNVFISNNTVLLSPEILQVHRLSRRVIVGFPLCLLGLLQLQSSLHRHQNFIHLLLSKGVLPIVKYDSTVNHP